MAYTRPLVYLALLLALVGTARPAAVRAQAQKPYHPHQKVEERQEQEALRQGGYQAPPPTGALRGPTRELGLSGGEIELPAIRLRLPRIRFPALSQFITPPQMEMERGVAPVVQQVQEQVSVPTGRPREPLRERPREPFRAPGPVPEPLQKQAWQQHSATEASPADLQRQSDQIAQIQAEMAEFENRLEHKLARLTESINLLVAERRAEIDAGRHNLQPLPMIEDSDASAVRPSSFTTTEPVRSLSGETPEFRRLPPTRRLPSTSGRDSDERGANERK